MYYTDRNQFANGDQISGSQPDDCFVSAGWKKKRERFRKERDTQKSLQLTITPDFNC